MQTFQIPPIELETDGAHGRYVIHFPNGMEAEMTFMRSNGVMAIDHTLVPPALEGRGIAAKLVERAVADARAEKFKIQPICSYVVVAFQRHKHDWADVAA
jgi:predicted GNAT family acetyltransferase